jgi:hypothetical protein
MQRMPRMSFRTLGICAGFCGLHQAPDEFRCVRLSALPKMVRYRASAPAEAEAA